MQNENQFLKTEKVGKLLAETLKIPYYDKDIVLFTAEKAGLFKSYNTRLDEENTNIGFILGLEPDTFS